MTENQHLPAQSSVIMLRLHDFARRPVAEQARLSAQLDTLLALLLPALPEKARIVLSGNGSAAVAVLDNVPAALAFAEHALHANHVGLGLCIGIDHGPVEIVSSDAGTQLAGDGVATASVMAAAAHDAGLLVTQNFRSALALAAPGTEYALVPTVNFSDAGLRTYQVFSLDRLAARRRRRLFAMIALSTIALLLIAATALRLGLPNRPRPLAEFIDSSIPFMSDTVTKTSHGKR